MSKVKINDVRERIAFSAAGKRETLLDVQYETAKGYTGIVTLPKKGFNKEKVTAAVKKDMAEQEAVIGTVMEI